MDVRPELYKNIVLSGASTMFPGYASRIESELKAIYTEKNLKLAKTKTIKIPINIIDSPRRKYSVFIGAAIFANLSNKEQAIDYWISKQDWEESGPKIILKKCTNILK
jgi:actin-related protein